MEIGNILFGHSRGNYEVDRSFQLRFQYFLEKAGYDGYGVKEGNKQAKSFIVRPYWWGDDDAEEANLPNFECPELGLTIKWYKYPMRDAYSNIPFTEEIMSALEEILNREGNE